MLTFLLFTFLPVPYIIKNPVDYYLHNESFQNKLVATAEHYKSRVQNQNILLDYEQFKYWLIKLIIVISTNKRD